MIPAPAGSTVYRGFIYTPTNAVSDQAQRIGAVWGCMLQTLANVASLRPRLNAVEELETIYMERRTANWDGEGAARITETTYEEALKFLMLLPLTVATPDIVPEPNGSIGFEWNRNQKILLLL